MTEVTPSQDAQVAAATSLELGKYSVHDRLGQLNVYRATNKETGRQVLMKVLPAWNHHEEAVGRFEREIQLETRIQHKNVAKLLDFGREEVGYPELVGGAAGPDGTAPVYYFVREHVAGEDLQAVMARGPMPVVMAINVAIQVTEGLSALHEVGVIHRHIHPSGIVLTPDQEVKMIDFGLVKFLEDQADVSSGYRTMTGQSIGTAGYMAPEQVHGGELDAGSDLFCVGILLYELISGQNPFPTGNLLAYFDALRQARSQPISELVAVPAAVEEVLSRLLSLPDGNRYLSAQEASAALAACLLEV